MNTAIKTTQKRLDANLEPVLRKVLKEAEKEHRELQDMFETMGWGDLPDALKMEIKDDVSALGIERKLFQLRPLCGTSSPAGCLLGGKLSQ